MPEVTQGHQAAQNTLLYQNTFNSLSPAQERTDVRNDHAHHHIATEV